MRDRVQGLGRDWHRHTNKTRFDAETVEVRISDSRTQVGPCRRPDKACASCGSAQNWLENKWPVVTVTFLSPLTMKPSGEFLLPEYGYQRSVNQPSPELYSCYQQPQQPHTIPLSG